jgi:hypothetical protein
MQPVEVIAYAGYRGDQEPRAVVLDGRRLRVHRIERRWRDPEADGFQVRLEDGRRLELRRDRDGEWWSAGARPA